MRCRRTLLGGVFLATVVLGTLYVLAASSAGARTDGGPLSEEVPPNAVAFSVTPRTPFTYGGVQLRNPGPSSVVLEGVRLQGATTGLRVVSAHILPIADTGGGLWFSHEAFPPPGLRPSKLRPLGGYELAAVPEGVQVLLELEAERGGRFQFASVTVDYRADGRAFAVTFPFSLRVCAAGESASSLCQTSPPVTETP